jgi:hypothetical protein
MSENNEDFKFPPEVEEILDLASNDDGLYSAKWVTGGIQLVLTNDTRVIVKEHYWPEADQIATNIIKNISELPE